MRREIYTLCAETGKRCLTHDEAKRDVESLRRTRDGEAVHLYQCPHWRVHPKWMYHVGHVREKAS